ncbi:ATPase [Pedobacter yulinensis]|uniref:ATPase n=1 Tax=Pedobacter yulinensis TaxID=2126353 RepID=A0A2T3HJE5_9SPHI|nr:SRPBCC domain-containing protein [Pedobacter yulinensis]PST82575.1 ATPase [Pedobacter yulinensis]
MELQTKIEALPGRQDLSITRTFDIPVGLLFKAHTEPELLSQWMGTKVLKMETTEHGSYRFETADAAGNVLFSANGTIHKVVPNQEIVRTFEMENAGFPVQLEFLEFSALDNETSQLTMQIVYRSEAVRSQVLKMPFAHGLNMAHNRLQALSEEWNNRDEKA